MLKKFLATMMAFVLAFSCIVPWFKSLDVLASNNVEVTGVGVFDGDSAKGIHTFNADSKLIQVTFNDTFWSVAETAQWVEWEASINDYLLINGKKPQEWIDASWGSVQIHIKKTDGLGQYLEINVSGYAGLPTEDSDSIITLKAGFAGKLTKDVTYKYTANSNVPYVKEIQVTGVGVFDGDPAKGIHTFNADSKLIQVTFNDTFWSVAETAQWVEWEASINDYLLINGKKPQEWIDASWGSVQVHVKKTSELGQYLEINVSGYAGLPTEDSDSTITLKSGFAGKLTEDVTYKYTANNNVPYVKEVPVPTPTELEVTGVGVFDGDPAKGIHTFNADSKLIQVTFNDTFWSVAETAQWVEWEASINDYLLINGKKPQEWIDASWGSVQVHVKKTSELGQYLEINVSGYAGLPTEDSDSTITLKSGFAGKLTEDVTYKYTANNNVPYVKDVSGNTPGNTPGDTPDDTPVMITGVGIMDQTPNKGIHTFDNGNRLIQVTFNKDFWSSSETQDYVELLENINTKLLINGKTPSQWVGDYGSSTWGCVTAHVKKDATLGQYLEINFIKNTNVTGLPTEDTDSTITFLEGFAGVLAEDVAYKYTANNNVPYVIDTSDEKPNGGTTAPEYPKNEEFDIIGVGIFDSIPTKGIHTFEDGKRLIQIPFTCDVVDPSQLDASGSKYFVEWDLGQYVLINGKTPSELVGEVTDKSWGCVQMHIKTNPTMGQYLEINLYDYPGLPAEYTDSTIQILAGLTTYDGKRLGKTLTYEYTANQNQIWKLKSTIEEAELKFSDGLVAGIGIFDQTMYKGIHDFGDSKLIQVKFNQAFYNPKQLDSTGSKLWVQNELGEFIKINGRTVSQWNVLSFNSVQLHVRTSDALGGQYLEIIMSNLEGLPQVGKDATIEILSGFPVYGGTNLEIANTFVFSAEGNNPFVPGDTTPISPQTGDDVNVVFPLISLIGSVGTIGLIYLSKTKKGGAKQ